MNCKPGDLAIVVSAKEPEFLGVMVEVMYAPNWAHRARKRKTFVG